MEQSAQLKLLQGIELENRGAFVNGLARPAYLFYVKGEGPWVRLTKTEGKGGKKGAIIKNGFF